MVEIKLKLDIKKSKKKVISNCLSGKLENIFFLKFNLIVVLAYFWLRNW